MWRFSSILVFVLLQGIYISATPVGTSVPHATPGMMPVVQNIDVKCGRSGMTVLLTFDRPFPGVVYSKGHYYDPKCNYVSSSYPGGKEFSFLIPIDSCGTVGHLEDPTPTQDMYFSNIVIIQNDPLIQEVWDIARDLKCSWPHTFSKSVDTKPIIVESPEKVDLQFDSRSINTLMQIQQGGGGRGTPLSTLSTPATGYIYVGDETSLVIYLKGTPGVNFDANPVSCVARGPVGPPVPLVDQHGCLVRASLLTPFEKLRNPEGVDADLMIYSYFKAFRVGDESDFKITCELEICDGPCLEPCALGPYSDLYPGSEGRAFKGAGREKRAVEGAGIVRTRLMTTVEAQSSVLPKEERKQTRVWEFQQNCSVVLVNDISFSSFVILFLMTCVPVVVSLILVAIRKLNHLQDTICRKMASHEKLLHAKIGVKSCRSGSVTDSKKNATNVSENCKDVGHSDVNKENADSAKIEKKC